MGKDLKGKELGMGLSQKKSGLYMARFKLNKRTYTLYNRNLKQLRKDFLCYKLEVESNDLSNMNNYTVDQLYTLWLEKYTINLKNTSILNSIDCYKRVKENIGSLRIKDIRQSHIQGIINDMNEKQYSYSTIVSTKNFLFALFTKAIENRIITFNPCSGVILPHNDACEKIPLSKEMEEKFFKAIYGQRYEELFHVLLYTGMRIGEALALEWKDINFTDKTINISKTLLRTKQYNRKTKEIHSERVYITAPKTYTSTRLIPLNNYVATQFLKWKAKQEIDKQRYHDWGNNNYLIKEYPGLIFTTSKGSCLPPGDAWKYCAQGVSKVNELEICTAMLENREAKLLVLYPHLLRHTYATRCMEAGMHPKAIQKLLGHSSLDMLNVYTHPNIDFLLKESEAHSIEPVEFKSQNGISDNVNLFF